MVPVVVVVPVNCCCQWSFPTNDSYLYVFELAAADVHEREQMLRAC
jgi:hypothetical protein